MKFKVENVAKSFGKKEVLKDISFEMQEGTMFGVVGENGAGKSTLLKIIVGQWKSDKGKVTVEGRFGYCPQETLLFPQLTVEEHFSYFSKAYGITNSELSGRSTELMEHFNFSNYRHERVFNLSGGTKQKLNLSIALLHQPDLLILDEPYNGFDWETYLRFWKYTDRLREMKCAILVVAHLISDKKQFDRIYDLENGYLK